MTNIIMHLSIFIVSGGAIVSLVFSGLTTLIVAPVLYCFFIFNWLGDAEYRKEMRLNQKPIPLFEMSTCLSLLVISLLWEYANG